MVKGDNGSEEDCDECVRTISIPSREGRKLEAALFLCRDKPGAQPTKQKWIREAIEEKLNRDQEGMSDAFVDGSLVNVSVLLNKTLMERMERQIALIRAIHGSGSKRHFIFKAIVEKLDRLPAEEKALIDKLAERALTRSH